MRTEKDISEYIEKNRRRVIHITGSQDIATKIGIIEWNNLVNHVKGLEQRVESLEKRVGE